MKVVDAGLIQAGGQHGPGKAGAAGGDDGAHVDDDVHPRFLQPPDHRIERGTLLADGGEQIHSPGK